jgi:hypothetical protein
MSAEAIEYLNILLDQCEALTPEPHLKPYHLVAFVPLEHSVEDSLRQLLGTWRSQPTLQNLLLTELADWKLELAEAPFFSAGFQVFEPTSAHEELKSQFFELLQTVISPDTKGYRLASHDSAGQSLCPHGGLHDYFVLVDRTFAILIDFDWDS